MINSLFVEDNSIISGLSRVSISKGKSRLSRSTRNSQSVALFNKPTLCSVFFVLVFLRAVCPVFTNSMVSFFTLFVLILLAFTRFSSTWCASFRRTLSWRHVNRRWVSAVLREERMCSKWLMFNQCNICRYNQIFDNYDMVWLYDNFELIIM